jgi:hypothetical protein
MNDLINYNKYASGLRTETLEMDNQTDHESIDKIY